MAAATRVCVKNLPAYITEEKLKEHFGAKGQITDAKIMRTSDGKSRRFGFVGFYTEEEAKVAVSYFNKSFLDTSRIICEMARPIHDASFPRPWSRHSKGSSAYQRAHPKQAKSDVKARGVGEVARLEGEEDPGLTEFLDVMQFRGKAKLWANDTSTIAVGKKQDPDAAVKAEPLGDDGHPVHNEEEAVNAEPLGDDGVVSDMQYLKNKIRKDWSENEHQMNATSQGQEVEEEEAEEEVEETGRLFVRNLAYTTSEDELSALFGQFGEVVHVHLVLDKETHRSKGFGYVLFMLPEAAERARKELDKSIFQGRLLHVLPAKQQTEVKKLKVCPASLKQEKEAERKKDEASGNTQAWNSLYMRPDTVAENVAKEYGVSKREFLNPEAGDLAVRLALGETHVITETKRSLSQQGVNVELLEEVVSGKAGQIARSSLVILVKNLPFTTTEADLSGLFGSYGSLGRLILPPTKTIAVVEFLAGFEARKAFESLAYRKFKHVPLYLEWAPLDLLCPKKDLPTPGSIEIHLLPGFDEDVDSSTSSSVFVKNLNFKTSEDTLRKHFEQRMTTGWLRKATIKTKPSKSGKGVLSMGFGFLEFDSAETARRVCKSLQGSVLEGHALTLQLSCRDGNPELRKKRSKGSSTKIIVRNVAFEATKKDLNQLFSPFGQMKRLKLPKKFDGNHRGFAFVEFVTKQEADNAFESLANTHLYGRHLVLEWAREGETLEELRAKTASQIAKAEEEPASNKKKRPRL